MKENETFLIRKIVHNAHNIELIIVIIVENDERYWQKKAKGIQLWQEMKINENKWQKNKERKEIWITQEDLILLF